MPITSSIGTSPPFYKWDKPSDQKLEQFVPGHTAGKGRFRMQIAWSQGLRFQLQASRTAFLKMALEGLVQTEALCSDGVLSRGQESVRGTFSASSESTARTGGRLDAM